MPPWRSEGAGGARGSKASASKRTVKGKQRAAHRRPPARLLARRRSPKSTIQRRAESAGRNPRLLRGGLAFIVVAALTAVSATWLLDSIADDGPVSSGLQQVATVEPPAKPAAPVVVTEAEQPAIASITPPAPEQPIAAALAEDAEPIEEAETTADEAENAVIVEAAEESEPLTADSIVAPAAPPPQAAKDDKESEVAEATEPTETDEPVRIVGPAPELREDQVEARPAPDGDTAQDPEAELADSQAAEQAEEPVEARTLQAAEVESDGSVSALDLEPEELLESNAIQVASESLQEQEFEVAALEEASPEPGPEVEAAPEESEAEALKTPETADVEPAASEPEAPAPEVVEQEHALQGPAESEIAALIEEEVTGPLQADPIKRIVAPQAAEKAREITSEPVERVGQDEALVALAADLMPQALPETAVESLVDSPEQLVEAAPETEGLTNGETAGSDLPTAAKKALAEVDALAEEVEKVLVEPVRLSELLPSDVLENGGPALGETTSPTERAIPVESTAPQEPLEVVDETGPAETTEPANVADEGAEATEQPVVEVVEASPEPPADEPPSILAESDKEELIPSEPLSSDATTQVASLAPVKRPEAAGLEASVPLPVRRPGHHVASLTATPGAAAINGKAPWQQNAVPTSLDHGSAPMIALVIDDLGLNRPKTWRTIELPAPLTLAFLTYATGLSEMTASARARGHELIVHMPMEPLNPRENPGRNALVTEETSERMASRLEWGLSRFEGYVGINNHMGSRFTAWTGGMEVVMREMRRRGLLFLDSLTTYESVGSSTAERFDVPYAVRDIFLDNQAEDAGAIRRQLEKLEEVALEKGYAVGIGHPYPVTLDVLTEWLPGVQERGFRLVPISAVVRHRSELAAKAE